MSLCKPNRQRVLVSALLAPLSMLACQYVGADAYSCIPYPTTVTENITTRLVFSVDDAHESLNTGDYQSALASWESSVYLGYINTDWKLSVAKSAASGTGSTERMSAAERIRDLLPNGSNPIPDVNHMAASVAVDSSGRVHLVGGMHHDAWKYYVSPVGGSISSLTRVTSSTDVGLIPGYKITYPEFQINSSGELFVSFRDRLAPDYWKPGYLFGSIARYNTTTKKWTAFGGVQYTVPSYNSSDVQERPAVVWDLSGQNGTAYQGYKLRLLFGKNDKMHLAWNIYRNPGDGASHVMYAASPNGNSWFGASGNAISTLPITSATGDVVWVVSPGDIYNMSGLAIGRDDKPIVSSAASSRYIHIYEPACGGWLGRKELPADADIKIYSDATGNLTALARNAGRSVYRSHDNGRTWMSYSVPFAFTSSSRVDAPYLRKTGVIRVTTQSGTVMSVYELTSDLQQQSQEPPDPTVDVISPPSNLRVQG